jgi:DNA (cytosine-5)-methyltransferase 1
VIAYYNEFDPRAAAWLRELISAGLIAPGDVDTRSIKDVSPHELTGYTQQHFFAGIGGWSLALRLAGWPDSRPVRTGSCPCQPFSQAGQGKGEADERHLWPVFRDLIAFGEPAVTFGEQVASAAGRQWLARVRADLEGLGYGVGAADLCAASVGAPHIRQRLFWLADPDSKGLLPRALPGIHSSKKGGRPRDGEPVRRGNVGRLADAHGRKSGDGDLQRRRQHGLESEDGLRQQA